MMNSLILNNANEMRRMEFLTIKEFAAAPKNSREKLERDGKMVLTNNGKPMALMLKIGQTNFEEVLRLAQQIEGLQLIDDLRMEAEKRGFLSDEEINEEIETYRREKCR